MFSVISEIINNLTSAYWHYLPNSQTAKMIRFLPVVNVLLSLTTHALCQYPSLLDPATVPCNPVGYTLYMSTSVILLNRTRIMSSNFTNKGQVRCMKTVYHVYHVTRHCSSCHLMYLTSPMCGCGKMVL